MSESPDELDVRLDDALWVLQMEIAALAVMLPDLPPRHVQLIDNVLEAIRQWELAKAEGA